MLAAHLGAKKVYAFEPISNSANVLMENIRLNNMQDKITVVQMALGDKNESQQMSYNGITETVKFTKLDSFVSENNIKKIDFIKSDVEGFEDRLLIGATEVLKKFKPVLSLASYHKGCDKEKLSEIIKSIREDYNIIVNNFDEEDIYCW
ncbi:Methyltransferase FkbM domain protein [uncultured archaeon]|nr:Methyltransferase FkbM domain protein [uncultured archaeon]